MTQLRNTTRLDPMTYMLFGAYNLNVTQSGLQCDNWLPVAGNLQALDDIQRLKTLFDGAVNDENERERGRCPGFTALGKKFARGTTRDGLDSGEGVDGPGGGDIVFAGTAAISPFSSA